MVEINNQARVDIDLDKLKKVTEKFLDFQNLNDMEVSLALVTDKEMKRINQAYRDSDRPTDVLAFPVSEKEKKEENFLGEILLDWKQIKRQARKLDKKKEEELIFILIHGLLHLLGYKDETSADKEKMLEKGKEIIKELKF